MIRSVSGPSMSRSDGVVDGDESVHWLANVVMKNWAGNVTYSTTDILRPRTVEDAQELVARTESIRPLGTRHSFSLIGDSNGALLSTEQLDRVVDVGADTVTVE